LLYALGYNFSVAVWVGFIALFGTAVQTAVVMVIYLEEAVSKKREALDGRLTREALMDAVKEGALLRLRPKVMTDSTVLASLLPSESGQWKEGKNSFVLELTSPTDQQPVDAGKVSLNTSMAMPGMAPMITGATLTPEKPGRYTGTIEFSDRGTRQVTVTWDGPA